MYYIVCSTCEDDKVFRDRESAQEVFNEHAQQQHEVVLRRVELPAEELISKSSIDAVASETANTNQADEIIDILLVEDNPGDVRLIQEAFKETPLRNELHVVSSGNEAVVYLHQRADYKDVDRPDIVLLDLNLPGMSGFEVLEEIKTTPELRTIPVIILTSSQTEEDIIKSYEKHANAYLTKPVTIARFVDLAQSVDEFWLQMATLPPDDA